MTACEADASALAEEVEDGARSEGYRCGSVWPGLSCDQPHRFGMRRGLFWVEAGEPVEPTVSLGAWRKACANRLGDRDPRGFKGFVVAVHASIVAQHASERHARICCESRDSRGTP